MTIFTDSFTGSNGATALDTGWSSYGSGGNAAVIQSNALAVEADNFPSNQSMRGQDTGSADHFCECTVGANAGGLGGPGALLAVRVVDRNEWVGVYYDTDRYRLYFQGHGGSQASYVTALVPGDEIRLEANGTGTGAYILYINGVNRIQLDWSDAAYNSQTKVGCLPKLSSDADLSDILDNWRSGTIADLSGGGGGGLFPPFFEHAPTTHTRM